MKKWLVINGVVLWGLISLFSIPSVAQAQTDSIAWVGSCVTPGYPWNVFVVDTIAYVADYYTVAAISVSDPSSPWIIGTTPLYDVDPIGLLIQDTIAYLNQHGNGFSTVSIANPKSLYTIGDCNLLQ